MVKNLFRYVLTKPYRYIFGFVVSVLANMAVWGYDRIWALEVLIVITMPVAIVILIDLCTLLYNKSLESKR